MEQREADKSENVDAVARLNSTVSTRLLPRKCDFRQRAHCNPLSDSYLVYPPSPDFVDWRLHFPSVYGVEDDIERLFLNTLEYPVTYTRRIEPQYNGTEGPRVEFLDVGCGYGGLSLALAEAFPKTLIMGMEIREKVTTYVGKKILGLRKQFRSDQKFTNVSVLRTNVMKFLVNYFRKAQLSKMFFCFPDPHFKRSNERRRIIGPALLSLYAYVLAENGIIYTVSDVESLHDWMRSCLLAHSLYQELPITEELRASDPCIHLIETSTEEGAKVLCNVVYNAYFGKPGKTSRVLAQARRLGRPFYMAVFRRRENPKLM